MIGRTSVAVTEQVRQASDIVDVVASYVTLRRAGKVFKALCPFHQEKTPSFHVNPEKQIFKCFGCGVGGDVFKFIQLRENIGFMEAKTVLAERAGITIQVDGRSGAPATGPSKADIERANRWASRWFQQQFLGPAGEAARAYVNARGISEESVDRFAIGYAPDSWDLLRRAAAERKIPTQLLITAGLIKEHPERKTTYDAFRNRLMFPIHDVMGRTIGFGGRTLGEDSAKYVNSPQSILFDKRRCLYGLNIAKGVFGERQRTAVVVEGYIDCIMAQQHGFGHTVATLGTALTIEHVRLLRRYVESAILVFDSDTAGRRAADQSLPLFLGEQLDVRLAHIPKAKDPAELLQQVGSDAFKDVLTSATDALESKWNEVLRQYQGDATGAGRRRVIEEFLGLIHCSTDFGACDPIQRGLILNQVGKLLGLPSEEVHRQLRIVARRSTRAQNDGGVAPQSQGAYAPHAASAAMRDLLEVLLNEPSYFASISSEFDPALILDPPTREIAQVVAEMAQEGPDFTLQRLLGRFESVEAASRIMALQSSGEQRGNHAATVEGAVKRLQQLREQHRVDDLEAQLRADGGQGVAGESREGGSGEQPDGRDVDDQSVSRAAHQGAQQIHRFAARRHLAPSMAQVANSETPQGST